MELEKNYLVNSLLEFYQPLLTKKQRNYMQSYYVNDFSLGEISQNTGVSRQAIYDNLNRTEHTLEKYEERLHLYRNFVTQNHQINQLRDYVSERYPEDRFLKTIIQNLERLEDR